MNNIKKIAIVLFVIFWLYSCNLNETENITTVENQVKLEKSWNEEFKEIKEKSEGTENINTNEVKQINNLTFKKDELLQIEKERKEIQNYLKERKENIAESFNIISNLDIDSKSNLDCKTLFSTFEKMDKQDEIYTIDAKSKCILVKNKAIEELKKKKESFTISDCRKIIDNNKKINQKFVEHRIKTCEIWFALQKNDCNLLVDETKKIECNNMKKHIDIYRNVQKYSNFDLADFIKLK